MLVSKVPTKIITINNWHQFLTHANDKVIQHLKLAVEKINVFDQKLANVFKTNECETCVFFKMHCIVSQSFNKKENSNLPLI